MPRPYLCGVRKNKTPVILQDLLVESYAAEGKALAHQDGKVIFIEGAVPGDVVDIVLLKNKKDWAEGRILRFQKHATERVEPFCSHFGICGGCQWQMLPYHLQLKYKQQQVVEQLTRIAKIPLPEILPILGCDNTIHYRNKLEYTFATRPFIPAEEFRAMKLRAEIPECPGVGGFHAKGMFDKVVEIDVCHLQAEPTNKIRKAIVQYCLDNEFPFYDLKRHTGWLRNMQIRMATTGEIMVNIILGMDNPDWQEALLAFVQKTFPEITTLLYTINKKRNDSLIGLEPQVYNGRGFIYEQLGDIHFKIGPTSFFQTNTKQAENLYGVVRDFAQLQGNEIVYDLYCGTGSIGLFLHENVRKIVGVEIVAEAVQDAMENAALNKISHAAFFQGDVVDVCDEAFFQNHGKPDLIIIDPPRAGLHVKLITKLLEMGAPKLIYVSCNPATQARDLSLLAEKYVVKKLQPVDMFPHTHHIENVVLLTLK